MCVMPFGVTCSPSIAQYVKNRNADEHRDTNPAAANSIRENTYVDDWLFSGWNIGQVKTMVQDVRRINGAAGFEMGKWSTNSKEIMESLEIGDTELGLDEFSENKVLGMKWRIKSDEFVYKVATRIFDNFSTMMERPTKRELLSCVISTFRSTRPYFVCNDRT